MIVVVDTNILFSACITPNSKITEILLSSSSRVERISCHYLLAELFRHQAKLIQLSKQPADKVAIVLYSFFRQMEFFNENIIEKEH
ncbi:PIN domain-containing protein [Spirosoma areae]